MPTTFRASLLSLALALSLGPALLATPAVARIDDLPSPDVNVNYVSGDAIGTYGFLRFKATKLTPDVEVVHRMFGCDDKVIGRKHITDKTGKIRYAVEVNLKRASHRSKMLILVKQPDHQTSRTWYTWTFPGKHCD